MGQGDEHIEHIKRALWSQHGRPGASVMVGAGFSLNAVKVRSDAPPFLTWPQLAARFEERLGYSSSGGRGTSDALRLASEFETAFGPNALEELVRDAVPDESYKPGVLHDLLVSLPWVDIFTTNYDQLLERTSRILPESRYSVVRTIRDIPASARPRIVKLHGSFPSDRPFILTEEHYRTYPIAFAPFVNLVRQAVMETVFCLVGFSGDDPNFLQWSGWVRDSLGPSAPPIYLCGVLDLAVPRQHLLRSRQVIPIDLGIRFPRSEHPDPYVRHRRALEWFLRSLHEGRPFDDSGWPTPPPPPHDDSSGLPPLLSSPRPSLQTGGRRPLTNERKLELADLCELVTRWHAVRVWYPGWICMPDRNRRQLWSDTRTWLSDPELGQWIAATEAMPAGQAVLAWYELAWRIEKTLCPVTTPLITAISTLLERINPFPAELTDMPGALTPGTDILATTQWLQAGGPELTWASVAACWIELAFVVTRCAREDFESALHARWLQRLARLQHLTPENRDRYFCEKAMLHVFRLEQQALSEILLQWKPDPLRPFFLAKHAALLAEYGNTELAREELQAALVALRGGPAGHSKQVSSEEGWVLWLLDALDSGIGSGPHVRRSYERRQRLDHLAVQGCDPDDLFTLLSRRLRDMRLGHIDASSGQDAFDPGYRKHRSRSFRIEDPNPWFFVRALEAGAAFVRSPGMRSYPEAVADAASHLFFMDQRPLALSLLLRAGVTDPIESLLDRATIACLTPEFAAEIYDWLSGALREAVRRTTRDRTRTRDFSARLLLPLGTTVSLLLFRLPESRRDDVRKLLVELYEAEIVRVDRELPGMLRLLFRRAFYCMAPAEVCRWLPELLSLHIVDDTGVRDFRHERLLEALEEWVIPWGYRLPSDDGPMLWSDAVDMLLGRAALTSEMRHRALYRLAVLSKVGGLNDSQSVAFARVLWKVTSGDGLPADTNLLDSEWLRLPAPAEVNPLERLRRVFLDKPFPPVLIGRDDELGVGMSYSALDEFVRHVEAIKRSSHGISDIMRRHVTISWTRPEVDQLLVKFEEWTTANVRDRYREFEELDEARVPAVSLLMDVLAPVVAPDVATVRRMSQIARAIDRAAGQMTAVHLLQYLASELNAERLGELLLDAFYDLTAHTTARVADAGDTFVRWIAYAGHGLCAGPSESLVGRVIDALIGGRLAILGGGLRMVSRVLEFYPAVIDDRSLRSIERALGYLADATKLGPEAPGDPAARGEARPKPQLRADAARAAFQLSRFYEARSRPASDVVERWRSIAKNDPLPEVRQAWFAPERHSNSAVPPTS